MAMGKGCKVFHNILGPKGQLAEGQTYSLVMELRNKNEVLLFENYAIATMPLVEFEPTRKMYSKLSDAYGCLGVLRINAGEGILHFLVLITGCNSVGKLGNNEIYRVTNVQMISMRGFPPDEERVEEIKKLLCCGTFYYSWNTKPASTASQILPTDKGGAIDLTLAAQKALNKSAETDNRFFWNRMFFIPFVRYGVDSNDWLLKVMCGCVEIRTVYVGSRQAKAAVISRLSSDRAGTRFQVRGVDDNGKVANFAETEQIILIDDEVSSFLQIRGSVPLFWEQPGINVGSHKIKMMRGPELSAPAFDKHLKSLKQIYGNQAIVNLLGSSLVGSKEGEATLSTAFQTHHKQCDHHLNIPHILFDYHEEVKSGGSKNLSKLKTKVQKYMEKFGFYTRKGTDVTREQYGTVRTNCTDCLDRTNCVQSFLAIETLQYQLMDLNLTDKPNIVSRFIEMFRQMWINNGNELSKMYAGTAALGNTGSKLMDGARSAARTIQNNLLDDAKQEAIDILLFGTSFNSDLANRARVLLPPNYINAPRPILQKLVRQYVSYTTPIPLRVAVGTYNINGGKHFRSIVYKDVSLSDWLLDAHKAEKTHVLIDLSESSTAEKKPIDIYAIGFEEMVDLDAKNIMNTSSENAKQWATELTKILNRDEKFTLVTYQQLVGVCLYLFVRPEHAPYIKGVTVDSVKTGMGGATGNKGTVAIRFQYHATSLCFACSHFAAGQKNISERNDDYNEAVKKIMFPKGGTLLSHDYVFWCGDFNYRIDMARDDVKALVVEKEWDTLTSADQLKIEHSSGNVFHEFQEGPITFPPTYKYDLFSDDYDTSEKARIPAWTDRILWRKRNLHQSVKDPNDWPLEGRRPDVGSVFWYGRAELKQSDHRPVFGVFDVEVLKLETDKREEIFEEALKGIGPPDGSVLLQFENMASFDIQSVTDEHFMHSLIEELTTQCGEIRFTKLIHEMIWVAFVSNEKALEAVKLGPLIICGHDLTVHLKSPDWKEILNNELSLCSNNTIPFCGDKELNMRKESAKLLSTLSQLSFEELEDITMAGSIEEEDMLPPPWDNAPAPPRPAPPPPRPVQPPARPPEPPTRPTQPPSRPAPPPSRPAAPPSRPSQPPARPGPPPPKPAPPSKSTNSEDKDGIASNAAGFSDIFANITSPVDDELPISTSSGSIVDLAKADGIKHGTSSASHSGSNHSLSSLNETENERQNRDDINKTNMCPPPVPAASSKPSLPPRQNSAAKSETSDKSAGETPNSSTASTPRREMPPPPKRSAPPPLPPTSRPHTGAPPALPGRPPSGAPPPLPKR